MRDRVESFLARPGVAHIVRAQIRYSRRLGSHFAASITYFSVLAMVPLLASSFAILSLVLTRVLPDVFASLKDAVITGLGAAGGGSRIAGILDASLRSSGSGWTILIAVATAMWTGVSLVGHLRSGIRAQWEPTFEMVHEEDDGLLSLSHDGLLWRKGTDALGFLAMIGVLLVAFGTAQGGAALTGVLGRRLGLVLLPGHAILIRVGGLAVSSVAGAIFFAFLYIVLPRGRHNWRAIATGSLAAGVCLALVQAVAGLLVDALDANRTVQAFGSIIIVMLVFNVLARMVLFVAAWIATADQPAVAREWNDADAPLQGRTDTWLVEGHWHDALADRRARQDGETAGTEKTGTGQTGEGQMGEGAPEPDTGPPAPSRAGRGPAPVLAAAAVLVWAAVALVHRARRAGRGEDLPVRPGRRWRRAGRSRPASGRTRAE